MQTNNIDKACFKYFDACKSLTQKGHKNYKNLINKMTNIYSLLGKDKHRFRRGLINIIGSGLKVLFGTMDYEDAKYYDNALIITKENQEFIRNGLKEEINIMKSLNEQNQVLLNNYHILENKTKDVVESLDTIMLHTNELQEREAMLEYLQRLYDSIIGKSLELEIELDKIIDAILFLQIKIIHPFIMTPEKLITVLGNSKYENKMLFTPSIESYHNIIQLLEVKIFEKNNKIFVIISLPILKEEYEEAYEIITLPIVSNNNINIFESKENILLISKNRANFALKYNLNDCVKYKDNNDKNIFVCKELVLESTIKIDVCVLNVFMKRNFPSCKLKTIENNIEFFHSLNNNRFLFAITEETKYKCKCKNKNEELGKISNIGIINIDNNCKFSTLETDIETTENLNETMYNDVVHYGMENCCENIKINEIVPLRKLPKIKGNNLQNLKDLSIEINNQNSYISKMLISVPERTQGFAIGLLGAIVTLITIYLSINCIKGKNKLTIFNRCFVKKERKPIAVTFKSNLEGEPAITFENSRESTNNIYVKTKKLQYNYDI